MLSFLKRKKRQNKSWIFSSTALPGRYLFLKAESDKTELWISEVKRDGSSSVSSHVSVPTKLLREEKIASFGSEVAELLKNAKDASVVLVSPTGNNFFKPLTLTTEDVGLASGAARFELEGAFPFQISHTDYNVAGPAPLQKRGENKSKIYLYTSVTLRPGAKEEIVELAGKLGLKPDLIVPEEILLVDSVLTRKKLASHLVVSLEREKTVISLVVNGLLIASRTVKSGYLTQVADFVGDEFSEESLEDLESELNIHMGLEQKLIAFADELFHESKFSVSALMPQELGSEAREIGLAVVYSDGFAERVARQLVIEFSGNSLLEETSGCGLRRVSCSDAAMMSVPGTLSFMLNFSGDVPRAVSRPLKKALYTAVILSVGSVAAPAAILLLGNSAMKARLEEARLELYEKVRAMKPDIETPEEVPIALEQLPARLSSIEKEWQRMAGEELRPLEVLAELSKLMAPPIYDIRTEKVVMRFDQQLGFPVVEVRGIFRASGKGRHHHREFEALYNLLKKNLKTLSFLEEPKTVSEQDGLSFVMLFRVLEEPKDGTGNRKEIGKIDRT